MPIEITCQECHKPFSILPYQVGTTKFCSRDCKNAFQRGKPGLKPITQVTLICAYQACQKPFAVERYREHTARYCSRVCKWQATKGIPNLACRRRVLVTCDLPECGKTFERKPKNVNKTGHNFCSTACHNSFAEAPILWEPAIADAAYIAGILDGEGNISCILANTRWINKPPMIHISIGNTHKGVIEYLHKSFSGKHAIYFDTRTNYKNSKPINRFIVYSRGGILTFLPPLLPYLIIKQEQATLALAYYALPLSERRWDAQGKAFHEKFALLNKRGV